MSMTSAGEVLVVWMWSRLLVFDLRSQRSLTLNFTRDSSEVPQSPILATTLCSYHGREGVLVVGTFT
ncbi:hypothetical protein DL93DRAFT_2077997 [Clavulina sp. PMI_390]|nr:hypothetical protein DL93DRAFT_2077997 [Clavulina sp. PMI_390]